MLLYTNLGLGDSQFQKKHLTKEKGFEAHPHSLPCTIPRVGWLLGSLLYLFCCNTVFYVILCACSKVEQVHAYLNVKMPI